MTLFWVRSIIVSHMTPKLHICETYTNPASFHIFYSHKEKNNFQHIPQELRKSIEMKAKREEFLGKKDELLNLEQVTAAGINHIVVVGLGEKTKSDERIVRDQTIKAIQLARKVKANEVGIYIQKILKKTQQVVEGVLLGDYSLDTFKGIEHKKKHPHIRDVYLVSSEKGVVTKSIQQGINASQANILTRDLVNMPGSHVYPETLAEYAKKIEEKSKGSVSVQILDEKECKKLGMGSFLCVGQGSDKKSVFIVLHYKGIGAKKCAIVGKSITFDTGGLSLKPGDFMMDMKLDMAGGATVLGIFDYLASQHPPISAFSDVYGVLPAAENMPSGTAVKPGDIVTAMNGKTIEVLNTDAEGRLVLADALVYAETILKADYIIDFATLTGACVVALGHDLAGLFTNNELFEKTFSPNAIKAGEDYWRMPLYEAYGKQMKSTLADLKNIGGGRYGGAITAALFLKEFIEKAKWIHIDIAGPAHHEKSGATGWGVLSVIYFLEQSKKV